MNDLDALILHEAANSALAFRGQAYRNSERSELVRDLVALANAGTTGPRMLIIGVEDTDKPIERQIRGVASAVVSRLRDVLPLIAERTIAPPLKVSVTSHAIRGKQVGIVTLTECSNRPYLLKRDVSADMRAGCGWIRRGTCTTPIMRGDLEDMFRARLGTESMTEIQVAFPGQPPRVELEITPLPLTLLPSAVAAERLRRLLEARESAKVAFGQTQTRFNRLLHAQMFDANELYEEHSDESLRFSLDETEKEYAVADAHYMYEVRAYPIQLVVSNLGDEHLQSGILELSVPALDGLGVADRLYHMGDCAPLASSYPTIIPSTHATKIQSNFPPVGPGVSSPVFRIPPRIWAREEAAGKTLELRCTVHSVSLRSPKSESLRLHIAGIDRRDDYRSGRRRRP
jgi:hypothetical protein